MQRAIEITHEAEYFVAAAFIQNMRKELLVPVYSRHIGHLMHYLDKRDGVHAAVLATVAEEEAYNESSEEDNSDTDSEDGIAYGYLPASIQFLCGSKSPMFTLRDVHSGETAQTSMLRFIPCVILKEHLAPIIARHYWDLVIPPHVMYMDFPDDKGLDYVHRMASVCADIHWAATTMQRQWRRVITDTTYITCRNRLLREVEEIIEDFGSTL